jgi:hypothetical protein
MWNGYGKYKISVGLFNEKACLKAWYISLVFLEELIISDFKLR